MRALLVGDIHLADRPPSMRTDSYREDILTKLEHTVEIAEAEGVHAVVWVGDVFHSKQPNRTSHALVQRTLEVGNAYHCQWLIVPGNHDIRHDRLDTLDEQPLGTLFKAGRAIPLVGQHPDYPLVGVPYLDDWQQAYRYMKNITEHTLVVAHAPILPPGSSAPYDFIDAAQWATVQRLGACYYGHIHDRHGTYVAGDVTFCNNGAICRAALHESDLRRVPTVTLWDNSDVDMFFPIELRHRPIEEVMRLGEVSEKSEATARLDEFLDQIGTTSIERVNIELVLEHIRGLGLEPDVEKTVKDILETVI